MGLSFRVLRVFGIDLRVHVTFFLVLLIGASWGGQMGTAGVVFGVVQILLLFCCVTLHEFGHAVVANRLGVPVKEIILLPIGGVALMRRTPDTAVHELLIAVAGPLVNVVIAAVLIAVGFAWPDARAAMAVLADRHRPPLTAAGMVPLLILQNVGLVLFNMVPAFPLDGGRVLRALLWMRMPMARATRIAATVGQFVSVVAGIYAILTSNWMLAVIALFVFTGAGAESAAAKRISVLAGRQVGEAYNRYALALSLDDRVSRVIDYVLTSYQPDFAVLHRGKFQGVVTRDDVLKWVATNNYDVYVTEVMHDDILHVDARINLDEVVQKLQESEQRLAAVFDGQTYLGLVSAEDIAEAQLVLSFLNRPFDPGAGGERRGAFRPIARGPRAAEPTLIEPVTEPIHAPSTETPGRADQT